MKPRRENPETALVRAALELLHDHGISAYRSNTGVAWRSKKSKLLMLDRPDGPAIPVKFGIPGTPDIIGWKTCVATVGGMCQSIAQWIGIECKVGDRTLTYEQWMFLNDLKTAGGIAITLYDDCGGLIEAIRDGRSSNLGKCPPKPIKRTRRAKSDPRQLTFGRRAG